MDYLEIYNTLDSTNKEAHRLLAQGPVRDGFTVLARTQSEGRGQYGRTWIAEPESHLAMTVICQPGYLSLSALPTLGMKVSLSIVQALHELDSSFQPLIKWPNDIYIKNKKLCGILIENVLSGKRIQHSIIGIGMNVNESHFPDEIPNAISLHQLTGQYYDPVLICHLIRTNVMELLPDKSDDWKKEYDQCLYGKETSFLFETNGHTIHAQVEGISIDGKLLVRQPGRAIQSFGSHEVKWMI